MAYNIDLASAARRHLKCADHLFSINEKSEKPAAHAVAGYLFGMAGELALKFIMQRTGAIPTSIKSREDNPFYAHFPKLRNLLNNNLQGRHAAELRRIAEDDSLFNNWDTSMRYAGTKEIKASWVRKWKASAEDLVAKMDAF